MAQRLVRKICSHCKTSYVPTENERANLGGEAKELFRGTGCEMCLNSGYQGRHGIYELMPITHAVRQQILKSPESTQLQAVAMSEGMLTLRDHGKSLALQGVTSLEEIWRVTRATESEV